MNKKELNEIKKQFKQTSNLLTIKRFDSCYVDVDRKKKFHKNENFLQLSESELDIYLDMFKKSISGSIGKHLLEFKFPKKEYEENGSQKMFYDLYKSELKKTEDIEILYNKIIENYLHTGDFYIFTAYCEYDVPIKNKNTDSDGESSNEVFSFVLVCISPAIKKELDLHYSFEINEVSKISDYPTMILDPSSSFMYPVFNDRTSDIHSILYHTKNPKEASVSLIENVLGCQLQYTAEEEQRRFNNLINTVLDGDVSYSIISKIHDQINSSIQSNVLETEPKILNGSEIKNILKNSGIKEEYLEEFEDAFETEIGKNIALKAVNLIDETKLSIKSPDITVNVKTEASDKVTAEFVNGKRCLVIQLDDTVIVNGLDVRVK